MNTLTVKELENLLRSEPFKYVSLVDDAGNTIVPFNNPKIKIDQRKKEILSQLRSASLPDGLYTFKYKQGIENNNIKCYYVTKGRGVVVGPAALQEKPEQKVIHIKEENVLSYASALEMQQKIATLTAQNLALTKENDELAAELDEMEEGGGPLQEGNIEKGFGFLEKIFEKAVPLADKYFEQREREVSAMEEIALAKAGVVVNKGGAVVQPKTTVTPVAPAPIPAPGTVQAIFTPAPGGGGSSAPGGGSAAPADADAPAADAEITEVLLNMPYADLEKFYNDLKGAGNLTDLQKFVKILKRIRPVELKKMTRADVE
jgi:hypothetical protein